jgi:hypothetical protein
MKKAKKFLGIGMVLAAFVFAGSTTAAAQAACDDVDGYTALYNKMLEVYAKTDDLAAMKSAATFGKEYLEKYGTCEPTKEVADWVKAQMPTWEKRIKDIEADSKVKALDAKFTAGLKASNWDDAFAAGRELSTMFPDKSLNIVIPLGAVGLYESYKKNPKYADESLRFAKLAVEKMKAGEASINNQFGVFPYAYGNKEDAMSEMTYAIAHITYHDKGDKKAALPYYYEVAQMAGRNKTEPRVFVTVGGYYLDEAKKIADQIQPMVTEYNAEATTVERKIELDKEIKAKEAVYKAYEERALDAFGRAHKVAKDGTAAEKQYRATLYKTLQDIYKSRFGKTDGMDSWIATTVAKPLPNPNSEVTPVADPTEADTTTSSTAPAGNGKTATVAKP